MHAKKQEIFNKMNKLHAGTTFNRIAKLAIFCLLTAVLGCSHTLAPNQLDPEGEAALVERVTERWRAMAKKDFASTYEYTTPNYRRVFSKTLYLHKFSYALDLELTGIEVVHYDARAAVASVAVRVMSKPAKQTRSAAIFGATPVTLRESWIFAENQWWHNPKN